MGTKVTVADITNVDNSSGIATLNANFDLTADEFDAVLYKDGSAPLTGTLDADSNRIINLADALNNTEPVTFGQFTALNSAADATATALQAVADAEAIQVNVTAEAATIVLTAATVSADAATVAADKLIVSADKATTLGYKNEAQAAATAATANDYIFATTAEGVAARTSDDDAWWLINGDTLDLYTTQSSAAQDESFSLPGATLVTSAINDSAENTEDIEGTLSALLGDNVLPGSETVGVTDGNDSTANTSKAFGSQAVNTYEGTLSSVTLRMSTSGTGELVFVNVSTGAILHSLSVSPTVGSNNTEVTLTTADFGTDKTIPAGTAMLYQQTTGGHVRYGAASDVDAYRFDDGDEADSSVSLGTTAVTMAMSWTVDVEGGITDNDSRIAALSTLLGSGGVSSAGGGGSSSSITVRSDGRNMYKAIAAVSRFRAGVSSSVISAATIGDSWVGRRVQSKSLVDLMADKDIPNIASGWIGIGIAAQNRAGPKGEIWTHSGWTREDASSADGEESPDGNLITATGTSATATWANAYGEDLYIAYRDLDGDFRWRIDGGSWTTVSGANTDTTIYHSIATGGDHTVGRDVEIDLTGNTGTVMILGGIAMSPNQSGFVHHALGNGSIRTEEMPALETAIDHFLAWADPDWTSIILGTNDENSNDDLSQFKTDYQSLVDAVIGTRDGACVITCPWPNNSTNTYSMAQYGSKMQEIYAATDKCELLRLEQLVPTYSFASAQDMDLDGSHPDDAGYYLIASETVGLIGPVL